MDTERIFKTCLDNVMTVHSSAGEHSTEEAERALLALVSAGDRSAMAKLYMLYFPRLANFFLHLTAYADIAEELINDTMVEAWQESASIGANASVSVAIMSLAYSRGQKRFAEAGATRLYAHTQPGTQDTDHDGTPLFTTSDTPSNPQEFLPRLPVEERAVLHLVYASGHSRQDIAEIMNTSCECVDVLLGDARRRLRRSFRLPDSREQGFADLS
jgi:DNA-directed RNA polymerase specialized sigma24 family protein